MNGLERPMTKTIIVTTLHLILWLAIANPAQAWPEQSSGNDDALTVALVHKHTHPHVRKTEHAAIPLPPTRLPDRDEDPLASMHFE
jgi:hypothetical protein